MSETYGSNNLRTECLNNKKGKNGERGKVCF